MTKLKEIVLGLKSVKALFQEVAAPLVRVGYFSLIAPMISKCAFGGEKKHISRADM